VERPLAGVAVGGHERLSATAECRRDSTWGADPAQAGDRAWGQLPAYRRGEAFHETVHDDWVDGFQAVGAEPFLGGAGVGAGAQLPFLGGQGPGGADELVGAGRRTRDERKACHYERVLGAFARSSRVSAMNRSLNAGSLTCFDACIGLPFSSK